MYNNLIKSTKHQMQSFKTSGIPISNTIFMIVVEFLFSLYYIIILNVT